MKTWQFTWLMGSIYAAPYTSDLVTIAVMATCAIVTLACLWLDK